MKILSILSVLLCMVFCFCACGNDAKTNDEPTTTAATTTVTEETVAETEAATEDDAADTDVDTDTTTTITEDEAIELVKEKYDFGEGYSYMVRDVEEVNGVSYYGVDLKKLVDDHYSYYTTYFVTTDGSDIIEGYYENDEPVLVGPKNEITEEEAIQMVKAEYDFGEDYGYNVRGVEEIDGYSYYGVDLRKLVNGVSTYQTTYFVAVNGSEIIEGYYENDKPVLAE